MKTALIIFAVLLAVFLILLLMPLRLAVFYSSDNVLEKASVEIRYMFFKFRIYPKGEKSKNKKAEKTEKQKKPREPFSYQRERDRIDRYIRIYEVIKEDAVKILRYTHQKAMVFENILVDMRFGFDNAMHTGIFTGVANGFIYSVLGIIHHNSTLSAMSVNVQPVFGDTCFNTKVECILRIKNVHIIIVAISVLKIIKRIRKEGSR